MLDQKPLYKRILLGLGIAFVIVIVFLLKYVLFPTNDSTSELWMEDSHQYDRSFVTLATNDNAVLGVLTLAYTLREVKSKYPLTILVSDTVTEPYIKAMQHPFLRTRIQVIDKKIEIPPAVRIGVEAWREALNKFYVWTLTNYTKVVYLDADQLVLQNIDDWFELPNLSGGVNQDLSCIPRDPPDSSQGGLNAAVLIFQPNLTTFDSLLATLNNGNDWGDSDQLNIKLAVEMVDAPHNKNWGIPNCDSNLYIKWKQSYHRVMAIVNRHHNIPEPEDNSKIFFVKFILLFVIFVALLVGYYKYSN